MLFIVLVCFLNFPIEFNVIVIHVEVLEKLVNDFNVNLSNLFLL